MRFLGSRARSGSYIGALVIIASGIYLIFLKDGQDA